MLDIDLKENAAVRPLIEEAEPIGRQEGRQEGSQHGRREQLLDLLTEKFGSLPDWAAEQIHTASPELVDRWARRFVRANSLEETFE